MVTKISGSKNIDQITCSQKAQKNSYLAIQLSVLPQASLNLSTFCKAISVVTILILTLLNCKQIQLCLSTSHLDSFKSSVAN